MKKKKISIIPFFNLNIIIYTISYIIFKNILANNCIKSYTYDCFNLNIDDVIFYKYLIPLILGIFIVIFFDIMIKKIIKNEKSYTILSKVMLVLFVLGIIISVLYIIFSQVGSSFCIGNDCGDPFSFWESAILAPIIIMILIYEYFYAIAIMIVSSLILAKKIFGKLSF